MTKTEIKLWVGNSDGASRQQSMVMQSRRPKIMVLQGLLLLLQDVLMLLQRLLLLLLGRK